MIAVKFNLGIALVCTGFSAARIQARLEAKGERMLMWVTFCKPGKGWSSPKS